MSARVFELLAEVREGITSALPPSEACAPCREQGEVAARVLDATGRDVADLCAGHRALAGLLALGSLLLNGEGSS